MGPSHRPNSAGDLNFDAVLVRFDRMPEVAGWSVRVDVGAAAAWPSVLSPKLVRNAFAERLEEHALRLIHETLVA